MKRDRNDLRAGIMLIASLIAVVVAFLVYQLQPWGPYVAFAVMLAWAVLAIRLGYNRRELSEAFPAAPLMHPVLGLLGLVLLAASLSALVYSFVLERQGGPGDTIDAWRNGGFFLLVLGNVGPLALEWLRRRLTGLRQA